MANTVAALNPEKWMSDEGQTATPGALKV